MNGAEGGLSVVSDIHAYIPVVWHYISNPWSCNPKLFMLKVCARTCTKACKHVMQACSHFVAGGVHDAEVGPCIAADSGQQGVRARDIFTIASL